MRPLLMTLTVASVCLALVGCSQDDAAKGRIYDIKGKVVSLDAAKNSLKLDHEAIPGVMKAMEMSFEVENPKLLDGLKAGDQVHGKLRKKDGKDTIIELMKH